MALRISPSHPLIWRTPHDVQFGVEDPVLRLSGLDTAQEFLLGLLQKGVSRPVLHTLAATRGVGGEEVDAFVARVTPALEHPETPPWRFDGTVVAIDGRGAAVPALEEVLRRTGAVPLLPDGGDRCRSPDLGVLVSHYATAPKRAAEWLCDDVPHLLVEFGDRSIRVGPMVVPGVTACAACVELARTDADACWPALASQLAARLAPTADAVGASIAAGLAVSALLAFKASARAPSVARARTSAAVTAISSGSAHSSRMRLRRTGLADPLQLTVEQVSPHPRCGCRSLPENARAPDRLLAGCPPPPTTAAAVPAPA
jgi:hypothetical protein